MLPALFTTQIENIPAGEWSRIYFGSEFCPWTFPGDVALAAACKSARQQNLPFSLVTPVLSEPFLPILKKRLQTILPELGPDDEVVISDLGAIDLVRDLSPEVPLVAGRVLSGQKRGPRILDLDLNPAEIDYFQKGSWYQQQAVSFLREQSIDRVELDNLLQGVAPLPDGLHGTLHLPWVTVSVSRNCPFREPGQSGPCPVHCGESMKLTTEQTELPLHQAGNCQFIYNDRLPDNLDQLGIDRVVRHLQLPR